MKKEREYGYDDEYDRQAIRDRLDATNQTGSSSSSKEIQEDCFGVYHAGFYWSLHWWL
jgi:hypothetical protein